MPRCKLEAFASTNSDSIAQTTSASRLLMQILETYHRISSYGEQVIDSKEKIDGTTVTKFTIWTQNIPSDEIENVLKARKYITKETGVGFFFIAIPN